MFTLKEFLPKINDKLNLGQNSETLKRVGLTETSSIYQALRNASTTASILSNPGIMASVLEMGETARMAQESMLKFALANPYSLPGDDNETDEEGDKEEEK